MSVRASTAWPSHCSGAMQSGVPTRTRGEAIEVVDADDVLVPDDVGGARLLIEAKDGVGVLRQRVVEELDRDLVADHRVLAEIDRPHPARPEPLDDAETAGHLADQRVR